MEKKELHIGNIVENAFNQSGLSKSEFASLIGIKNQNLNRAFKQRDWHVIKLIEAGKALNYDFSPLFSSDEHKKDQKPKMYLQIEIDEEKMGEFLKILKDKDLYNIIKRE